MAVRLVAGNWKMHGLARDLDDLARLSDLPPGGPQVVVCLPATLIARAADRLQGGTILLGGQDCHAAPQGAHTGCISAAMLVDAGASHVIVGHSERRIDQGETDAQVAAKLAAAQSAGLIAIVCVGETGAERGAGQTRDVLARQLAGSLGPATDPARLVLAYEPVWAIGTGLTPTLAEIADLHGFLRGRLAARFGGVDVAVLYGGSVKPGNAADIFAVDGVDGALVGGASLKAAEFGQIIAAGR